MSESGHHTNYVKVWVTLVILLAISVAGPELGIRWLTLFAAFGVAFIKAYIVLTKFMHVSEMPKFISYIVVTCLLFMLLFFSGTSPDVMEASGRNWEKPSWVAGTENDWVTVGHHGHGEEAGEEHEGHDGGHGSPP